MQDLNDLLYFSQVVSHGGFAPAGRVLKIPKSKLSRRVAQLEERLGVRLIERSSRRFRVTDIGKVFFEQSKAAVSAAERAEALVAASLAEPKGVVRFSCPTGLIEVISPMLPDFLLLYPRVRIEMIATDRAVDLIAERIDVALRVRTVLDTDGALTMRTLAHSRRHLLASPALANALKGVNIELLATVPTLSTTEEGGDVTWTLEGSGGKTRLTIVHSGFAPDKPTGGYNAGWLNLMSWIKSIVEYGPDWKPPLIPLADGMESYYAASIRAGQAHLIVGD